MKPRIAEVDAHNRFVRWTSREDIHARRLPHRSIHVLVFDSAGRLVVQQRHRDKLTYPLYWDVSASGHVEEVDYTAGPDENLDQVYHGVAQRELAEELAVRDVPLECLGAFGPEPGVHYEHLRLYRALHDGPYRFQAEEIERIDAVAPARFDQMVADPDVRVTHALVWFVGWLRREHGLFTTGP